MKNIKLLIGISGSGKSTYSHKLWETNPSDFVIINRDKIKEIERLTNEMSFKKLNKRSRSNSTPFIYD